MFNVIPTLVWYWVPGSMSLAKKVMPRGSRKLFFPGQFNLDEIVSKLNKLPLRERNYSVGLLTPAAILTATITFRRKSYEGCKLERVPLKMPPHRIVSTVNVKTT